MLHHSIHGWNVFHEQKSDAPPIISVRVLIAHSTVHQHRGFSLLYINLLRKMLHKEGLQYSIAGAPYVSWGKEHITIGVDTLEEDLREFLQLLQNVLRLSPTQTMLEEEKKQQYRLDEWNATQPQELLQAVQYEQFYGSNHPLCHDIDGTWRERTSITLEMFNKAVESPWGGTLIIVSQTPWTKIASIVQETLVPSQDCTPVTYPAPTPNWIDQSIPCAQSEQVGLLLIRQAPLRNDRLEKATQLGLMALAGMFHSRMNRAIRQEEGLSYGVDCHYIATKQFGRADFSCFVEPARAVIAYKLMQDTIQGAIENWSKTEIAQTKKQLIRMEKMREETCSQIASIRSHQLKMRGQFSSIQDACRLWEKISLHEVQEAMTFIAKAPQLTLCVGPKESIAPLNFTRAPTPQKYIFPTKSIK
jgi:predicted Zn-dependent peptidase